jgi:hypothetical protein
MKIPSLKLESKVLLIAVAICAYGFLRMAHVIHLPDRYETLPLFLIAFALATAVLHEDRNSPPYLAVYFLSIGLCNWSMLTPDTSISGVFLKWVIAIICAGGVANSVFSAWKDSRN